MEADLARWYHLDYRDRWRGGLTLRRLYVLLKHLPPESACVRLELDGPYWSLTDHLLDDQRMVTELLVHVMSGSKKRPKVKPHPLRDKQAKATKRRANPERERRIADFKRRRAAREAAIARGEIPDDRPAETEEVI